MASKGQKPIVTVDGLYKSYADQKRVVEAVKGVSFEIREGEFYTLLGPSGCGKTTTMRCVAGLEHTTRGEIAVHGRLVSSAEKNVFVPPNKRDIGMVFQSYAIWPHMTVFQNVAFPLSAAGIRSGSKEMRERVDEALALVELEGYADRFATQLSGGQQQRLALARALVRRPALLLLDEPLSNLDARLRDTMRTELRAIQRRLGITTLYVTHDQTEALSMSSRIAVMQNGEIVQEATPRELYETPANAFVAEFLGVSNRIPCTVSEAGAGSAYAVETSFGRVRLTSAVAAAAGATGVVAIRPEHLRLHRAGESMPNAFAARVASLSYLGEQSECQVDVNGVMLRVRVPSNAEFVRGDEVWLELPMPSCRLIADAP
jgi:iron(III) transport system ATP-binding protein